MNSSVNAILPKVLYLTLINLTGNEGYSSIMYINHMTSHLGVI